MELSKQERFMQVYEPVHERFERYCKTRTFGGEQFKDVMHDTLLIAYEKFETLKSKEAFLHFLFGIATRVLSNQRKKKQPEFVEHLSAELKNVQNDEQSIERKMEINTLYEQLEKLDDLTRECIILFEISGFSIKEISAIVNLSEAAVKQRLSRGRKELLERINSLENAKL